MKKISEFLYQGEYKEVIYQSSSMICTGVECDTYIFADDDSRDLAIVRVAS